MRPNPFWVSATQTKIYAIKSHIQKSFTSVTYRLTTICSQIFFFPFSTRKDSCSLQCFQIEKKGVHCPQGLCCGRGSPIPSFCPSISASAARLRRETPVPWARQTKRHNLGNGSWAWEGCLPLRPAPLFTSLTSSYCNSSAFSNFPPHLQPCWKLRANAEERENKGAKNKELGRGEEGREGRAPRFRDSPRTSPSRGVPASGVPGRRRGGSLGWPRAPLP